MNVLAPEPELSCEQIVSILPNAVALVASDFSYAAVSPAYAQALGVSPADLIGVNHLNMSPGFLRDWGLVFRNNPDTVSSLHAREEVFRHADGSYRRYAWTATVWRDGRGAARGILLCLGRERGVQSAKQGAVGEIEPTEEELLFGRLTRKLAHNFNNILTILHTGIELVSFCKELPPDERKLLTDLLKSVNDGAGITRKLLAAGRNQSLEPGSHDLRTLLEEIVAQQLERLPQNVGVDHIQTPMYVGASAWQCFIDKQQFHNAVAALVENSIEAMPQGGAIRFELVSADQEEIAFSIADSGEGMTSEALEKVTVPFFSTKEGINHAGLGASIAEGFFVRSGGRIIYESSPGNGCRVTCILPFREFVWDGANMGA